MIKDALALVLSLAAVPAIAQVPASTVLTGSCRARCRVLGCNGRRRWLAS